MNLVERTIIVPAALQEMSQTLCAMLAEGDAGKGMFVRGLCPPGQIASTHFISSGPIAEGFAEILPCTTVQYEYNGEGEAVEKVSLRPSNPVAVLALIAKAGVNVEESLVQGLLSSIDVSEGPAEAAMARLGLGYTPDPEG